MLIKNSWKSFFVIVWLLFFSCVFPYSAWALNQYEKLWPSLFLQGHLARDDKWLYLVNSELKFIDQHPYWRNTHLGGGLGYQIKTSTSLWAGYTWIGTNTENGYTHTNRLWEQAIWVAPYSTQFNTTLRTRFEENKPDQSSWYYRLRERLTIEFLHAFTATIHPLIYDEIFLGLNTTSQHSAGFAENRAFLGLTTPTSKKTYWQIGYMNQYIPGEQLNNVLIIACNINI